MTECKTKTDASFPVPTYGPRPVMTPLLLWNIIVALRWLSSRRPMSGIGVTRKLRST